MDLAREQNIDVLTIDVDEQLLVKGQLLVFAYPTVLVMKKGREVLRESKFIDLERVRQTLENINI